MIRKGTMALSIVAVGGLLLYSTLAAPESSGGMMVKAEVGKSAPDFKLKDTYGKEFTLSEFKGKIVVLEWMNKDCPVSRGCHEKSEMQNTYKKYADKGVIWLAIDSTHTLNPEKNRVYAVKAGLNYPVLNDADGKVGRMFQAKRTPHMFVIDKSGTLAYAGAIDDKGDKNYVAAAIDDLLANRPVAKPQTDAYGCGIKYGPEK